MKTLLLVAHVPSPNTLVLRDAIIDKIASSKLENVQLNVQTAFEAHSGHVLACDAILLGTTENLGYMSGALKDFFDRIYYPCLEKKRGLAYGVYIRAGLDGTGTARAVKSITTGLGWKAVQEPLICKGTYSPEFKGQCAELGEAMAFGLDAGIF